MTVELTTFSVIGLVFVIHTMLSHRLNWALRKANKLENHKNGAVGVVITAIFLELMFTLLIIKNILL